LDVEGVLAEVIELSSDVDHYGFGSMQDLLARGREVHPG